MIEITIRYGLTKSLTIEVAEGTTIGQIKSNHNYRAVLGLPENCTATVDGAALADHATVDDGDVILFEKQAASKA